MCRLLTGGNFSISAVIPAYFEEKTIALVVSGCIPYVDEVIVVNDGSKDNTSIEALKAGARVIELERNMGVAIAVQRGLKEASGDILVTLDADGQHSPEEIRSLVEPIILGECDLVMGVRPSLPYFSERVLSWLTSLRVTCPDASTGFRAIRKEFSDRMNIHGTCLCGVFVLEAVRLGARVKCVPISVFQREGSRRIQTRHIRQFFTVLWYLARSFS